MKKYSWQQRKWCVAKRFFIQLSLCITLGFFTVSCSGKFQEPIIIWTNRSEIVAYVELFNLTNENAQAIVVYKENPVEAFSSIENEAMPDIIIGPWLKNYATQENFLPIDYFFDDQLISKTQFYPQLLQHGKVGGQQYLLPVSFNLSTIVFSQKNSSIIPDNNMLNASQIQELSTSFNITDDEIYTSMGFAPSWTPEFLYEIAVLNNADFSENKKDNDTFTWDDTSLSESIAYFRDWTVNHNTSTSSEIEYQFKYLANPTLKNVLEDNSLFAFLPSNELFAVPTERLEGIYFRWLHKDNMIAIHDSMLSMGIYKHSKNNAAAEQFIIWFMKEENQRTILNWYDNMNLYTNSFGIAGGFSSIRSVNERTFPILYPVLWGNLPAGEDLIAPNRLPTNWDNIKDSIIIPYLLDATNTSGVNEVKTIQERLVDWYRFSQ